MWTGLGGQTLAHASIGWTRVLRPGTTLQAELARRPKWSGLRRAARPLAPVIDAVAQLAPLRPLGFGVTEPATRTEELTAEAFVAQLGDAARALNLYPDYDLPFVDWLFRQLDAVTVRGRMVRRLVRDPDGHIAGWYFYFLPRHGIAQVLQVAAPLHDPGAVFDDLLASAAHGGAAAVRGRIEPALLPVLRGRRCVLSRTEWALVHARQPEVLARLGSDKALLSRLEGEWWMGHHVLWRDGPAPNRGECPATVEHRNEYRARVLTHLSPGGHR
jgi:hypothetical protein